MHRWSELAGRRIQPLFMRHEGCLGALGVFLDQLSVPGPSSDSEFDGGGAVGVGAVGGAGFEGFEGSASTM